MGKSINSSSWQRGQRELLTRGGKSKNVLDRDDDDDNSRSPLKNRSKAGNKAKILEEF